MDSELLKQLSIPVFTGVIGYIINWTGVWMLFHPIRFHGVRIPGLAALAQLLPRRLQEVPGIMHGGVGWQGIVPNRAAKMGSIAVDKGIAKLGTASEFYQQLEPEAIAGLISFAHDPVRDRGRYQVLEVQPDVAEALKLAGRFSHVVRRSVRITPLGEDFCEVALPLDTAEFTALEAQPSGGE